MQNTILEFRNISYTDNRRQWLNDFSLKINAGDCLGIIAPSESIHCIISLLRGESSQAGSLIIDGKDIIKSLPINAAIRHGVEILCPPKLLFPNLTVRENLTFGLSSRIIVRSEETRFVNQYLNDLDLSFDLNAKLATISQEEQVLVGIAKTLIRAPRVILVDQLLPMTPLTLNKLQQIVLQKQRSGISFLFFSNRLDDILSNITSRVATINDGTISSFISMEDVRSQPELLVPLLMGKHITYYPLEERENQIAAYHVLQNVNALIASEYDMSFVFHFLTERICEMFEAPACRIMRINAKNQESEIISYGEQKIPKLELIDASVYRMQYDDSASYLDSYTCASLQYVSADCLPIHAVCISLPSVLHMRVVGVIQLFFDEPRELDEKALTILNSFSQQIALVVENASLSTQSTLLKEAHHRIKNNLQSVTSLLNLQIHLSSNMETQKALETTIMRIKAIASVHELLSGSSNASGMVDLKELFLILMKNYEMQASLMHIRVSTKLISYLLPFSKATSLALILNEIITNCFKHAFPKDEAAETDRHIQLHMIESRCNLIITIIDNGVGLKEQLSADIMQRESMGMKLIRSLATHDLDAEYEIRNNDPSGTISILTLSK